MAYVIGGGLTRRKTVSSGGLYTLPTTTDLELWLNAQTGVITDGSGVATWEDQSPRAENATRSIGNYQVVPAAINGFDVLSGVGAALIFAETDLKNTWSVFVVAQPSGNSTVLGNTGGWPFFRFEPGSPDQMAHFNGSTARRVNMPVSFSSGFAVYEFYQNNVADLEFYQNTAKMTSSTSTFAFSFDQIGRWSSNLDSNWQVADLIVYSAALSEADRTTIRNTLMSRYNL